MKSAEVSDLACKVYDETCKCVFFCLFLHQQVFKIAWLRDRVGVSDGCPWPLGLVLKLLHVRTRTEPPKHPKTQNLISFAGLEFVLRVVQALEMEAECALARPTVSR